MRVFYLSSTLMIALLLNNNNSCNAFTPSSITSISNKNVRTVKQNPFVLNMANNPLATEGDWSAFLDDSKTGLVYYFNTKSGESKWVPPTDTFPSVELNSEQKSIANSLRKEYRKQQQQQQKEIASAAESKQVEEKSTNNEKSSSLFGSFFGGNNNSKEEVVAVVEQEEEVEPEKKGGGLNFFSFGSNKKEEEEIVEVVEEVEEEVPSSGGGAFGGMFSMFGGKKDDEATNIETSSSAVSSSSSANSIDIDMSAYVLPHPAKVRWGGEDAIFCKGRTFGVFDGVSGAEKLDGIPLYSVTLAQEMKETVGTDAISINEITKQLTDAASFADNSATGASTAVVGSLTEDGNLNVLNVGDSSCIVVRDDRVVKKTRDIIHYFDCPYQLSEDSPDRPKDGTKLSMKVQSGDTILMGSDGVFDNLDDDAICKIVTEQGPTTRAAVLSRKIVEASRRVSLDPKADTPYAKEAQRNNEPDYEDGVGGKVDDVSCIVVKCS